MAGKVIDITDKGAVRVLVYGTLKTGHANHILLEEAGAQFLGYDSITGPYQMWDLGNIPAIMDSKTGNRTMRGELWMTNPEGLATLDMLEGHPHLYERRKMFTDIQNKRAWVYILQSSAIMTEATDAQKGGLWKPSADEANYWLNRAKGA